MTACHSEDDKTLYPWVIEQQIAPLWDQYAKELGFRVYTHGKANSKSKAAFRLSCMLRDNSHFLNGSKRTSVDLLLDEFRSQLWAALEYIKKQGIDRVNQQTGSEWSATLTFWTFCRDFRNIHTLANAYSGRSDVDDVLDMNRRNEKGRIIREFNDDLKSFAKQAAYLSGSDPDSNRRLEQALEIARTAMGQAQSDLEWMQR